MKIQVTDREFHTILAALRLWYVHETTSEVPFYNDISCIATNNKALHQLRPHEIETLCEELNTGERDAR